MKDGKPYRVIRDTREKDDHGWLFSAKDRCLGTVERGLCTGDYTIEGYEEIFVVERKGSIAEFAKNLVQNRFENELIRLDEFAHPFVVLEFLLADIVNFPQGSGIPEYKWKYLRLTPQLLMLKICELQVKHKAKLIFAGEFGQHFVSSLFKRIVDNVPEPA